MSMSTPTVLELMRRDLEDAAAHLGKLHDLRFKPMFGGLMAWLDERPCALLTPAGLALKLPPADQPALLQRDGDRLVYVSKGREGPLRKVEEFLDLLDE